MSDAPNFGYSARQVQAAALLLLMICGYLLCQAAWNPAFVSNPQPVQPVHASDLADRIDPNSADVASLSALPQVGPKRAREIVAYRERAGSANGRAAFQRPEDLLRLSGFGVAIVEQLRPYLIFPTTAPTTTQSVD